MNSLESVIVAFFFIIFTLLSMVLGRIMSGVFRPDAGIDARFPGSWERRILGMIGIRADSEMTWKQYTLNLVVFNGICMFALYSMQRLQSILPMNPFRLPGVRSDIALNTAISFVTNTNWQAYAGESTMSRLVQMAGLTVQNFLSAGTGMAVAVALVRGFIRQERTTIGNYWVDLVRSVLFILLPLSIFLSLFLVSQGVVQTFEAGIELSRIDPPSGNRDPSDGKQIIVLGPVASQVAIKQLGSNGGGFFNSNGSHPFENPTGLSNTIEILAIILIPGAFCFAFGHLLDAQGWVLFGSMCIIFIPLFLLSVAEERKGNPALARLGVEQSAGNLEGKEVRFGTLTSALWASATTATSNGSVNASHDSCKPLSGLVLLLFMQLGEVVFGGVGSGLYGMLMFAVMAVFIAGLMVGRTPEYLGKKLESFEMKMAALSILIPPSCVLIGTAAACLVPGIRSALTNQGPHGFSEILYAFSSAANNNGSAFGGLDASRSFFTVPLAACMILGRYWVILPVLAIAGSLARKKRIPSSSGTLRTDTPLFMSLLVGSILLIGALTFVPALAIGPVVEHLQLRSYAETMP